MKKIRMLKIFTWKQHYEKNKDVKKLSRNQEEELGEKIAIIINILNNVKGVTSCS